MSSYDLIEVTQTQLREAYDTLKNEMNGFVGEFSKTLTSSLTEDKPELLELIANRRTEVNSLPFGPAEKEPWPKYIEDFQQVEATLVSKKPSHDLTAKKALEENQLMATVTQLQYDFNEAIGKLSSVPLVRLSQEANLLRDLTTKWTVYQEAWRQRWSQANIPKIIVAGDKIARDLYDVFEGQSLHLKQDHQSLIVVPFMSELFAGGSEMPTPFIVAPRWGHGQVWTWLAYAHEVGHHIYRNVIGLSDELKVNIAFALGRRKLDYSMQRLWFNWLEEIFADFFGLLQTGPAFIQTQQRILLYLPPHVFKRVAIKSQPEQGLLYAADNQHPMPYLRTRLAIRALEKLKSDMLDTQLQSLVDKQCQHLRAKWEAMFNDPPDKIKVSADVWKIKKNFVLEEVRKKEFKVAEMDEVGEIVLDVILNSDLYTLGNGKRAARNIKEVFGAILLDEEFKKAQKAREAIEEIESRCSLSDAVLEIIVKEEAKPFKMRHLLAAAQALLEESLPVSHGPALSVTGPLLAAY
ncbi:MAG: hypothetical protein BroJett011_45670 [Chloroflexota bacterium]|nr:MAG: hypothetical protein BroJett011_45670 [Chloroflexota bacterium]